MNASDVMAIVFVYLNKEINPQGIKYDNDMSQSAYGKALQTLIIGGLVSGQGCGAY